MEGFPEKDEVLFKKGEGQKRNETAIILYMHTHNLYIKIFT